MSRNLIWRAVASSTLINREETHVFVDAPDYETAKIRIYERLSNEWGVPCRFIDFYNLWSETELREMSTGGQTICGWPLLDVNATIFDRFSPFLMSAIHQPG
ncbi:hypothetical protein [Serratia marcescens]|uniref:hypothetical protein n=1 Tax=Serratia marcescens TaxID=615 RepID=UPI003A8A56DC